MTDQEEPAPTQAARAQRFGRWISQAARDAGYDIDGRRSGGKKALAEAAGMGQTAVGRMLAGLAVPDPRYLEPLAKAVRKDLWQVLVEASVISPRALDAMAATGVSPGSLTPLQAAYGLGITIQSNVDLFVTIVEGMQRQESNPEDKIGAA